MWGLLRGAAFVAVVTTSGVVGWKLGGESAVAEVLVLQERTCGCCAKWSDHLRAQGFAVRVREIGAMEHQMLRDALGIDPAFASCHAALVGDYVVEGHVPAAVLARMLAGEFEVLGVAGVAVPGMPLGSPGMEGLGPDDPYDVIAFDRRGEKHVVASYVGNRVVH